MAKQDVLDAINATIVENGQKGITAQSLNNILTMIVENAGEGGSGEGGSGEGALRVMIPFIGLDTSSGGSEPVFTSEYFTEVGAVLEHMFPGASDIFNPVVEEMFSHNAKVYQQLIEKGVNREGVMCLLDTSAFLEAYIKMLMLAPDAPDININNFSSSIPSSASIVRCTLNGNEPEQELLQDLSYFFESSGGVPYGIVIRPILNDPVTNPLLSPYTQVELLPDGSVKMSIGSYTNSIFIPEEQGGELGERYLTANSSVKNYELYSSIDKIVKIEYGSIVLSDPLRVIYTNSTTGEIHFIEEGRMKKVVIGDGGSPTVTTLGTINLTTE